MKKMFWYVNTAVLTAMFTLTIADLIVYRNFSLIRTSPLIQLGGFIGILCIVYDVAALIKDHRNFRSKYETEEEL